MSRKLIHSLRALVVTFGVFAAALSIGVATGLDAPWQVPTAHSAAGPNILPAQAAGAKSSANTQRQRRREAREELALPFFSFAHGLRRGNGS